MRGRSYVVAALGLGLAACGVDGADDGEEETGEVVQGLSVQTQTAVATLGTGGFQSLGNGFHISGEVLTDPVTPFDLTLELKAQWQALETTEVSWDADKVRQGQTLEVGRDGSTSAGLLWVTWNLSGSIDPLSLGAINIGPVAIAADATPCVPKLGGSEYTCSLTSPSIPIVPNIWVPGVPYVNFNIGVTFEITPDGAIATRTLMLGDEAASTHELDITDATATESLAMPCNKPAGTTVDYALDPVSWTPSALTVTQQPQLVIGTTILIPTPFGPVPSAEDLFTGAIGNPLVSTPSITLTGPGSTVSLGELLANNVNPTVESAGPFSGFEGSPVAFSAATTSACPISSYVWQFSNGTTSFGPHPFRTFGDDGELDGQLTVTDITNLSGTGSFQVTIANKAPVPNAGPDTSGAWGTPIALNGQAVDPGSDDQATLTYEWNFGDGTPGTGGASVAHAYAAPGVYDATLKVCDDHTCATDSTVVTVRKRHVSASYTGTNAGTFSAPAALAGSLVDELGQPVVNGALEFVLDGASAGSANTNAAGNAARTITIGLVAGSYSVGVFYSGSGFYDAANSSEQFGVSNMATSLMYTGSTSGGANKTVNLSAKLRDALDRPLAGKQVSFTLGTQSASATTDADGIASAALKLAQKNGQYQLTGLYAGNPNQWTSASSSITFTISGGK